MESAIISFDRERPEAEWGRPDIFIDATSGADRVFRPTPALFELAAGVTCHIGQAEGIARPAVPPLVMSFELSETAAIMTVATDVPAAWRPSAFVIVSEQQAFERSFGDMPRQGRWHMPSDLRGVLAAIADNPVDGPVHDFYRRAKALELICLTLRHLRSSELAPCCDLRGFGEAHTYRIMKARAFIEERLHERLTLDRIARACGLNRTQLTKGFRELFRTSVADFFTEARLRHARHLLLTTDLMVGTVAARCGYGNNASFSRAYCRRFGSSPTATASTMLARLAAQRPTARRPNRMAESDGRGFVRPTA